MKDSEKIARLLKSDKSFSRIMDCLLEKYESYGESRGKITINNASKEECEALNGFLTPKKLFSPPKVSFEVKQFECALKNTQYSSAVLKEVLEEYYNKQICTNAEKKSAKQNKTDQFIKLCIDKFLFKPSCDWLTSMFDKKSFGYHSVMNEFRTDFDSAFSLLSNVCSAVDSRFESDFEPVRLAVLSANITGDSHYFDIDRTAGKLLINAIAFYSDIENFKNSEEINQVYSSFNIETNNITGTAAILGIRLFYGDNSEHSGFKEFADLKEPLLISLINLKNIRYADSEKKIVYVVENPAVFSALTEITKETESSLLCTFGQIKTVGFALTDMLVANGCQLYYAGDFDPEGLQIADNLISRYKKDSVIPWRMNCQDYVKIQKSEEIISQKRLSILKKIKSDKLKETALLIQKNKKPAYQELLIESMISDIKNLA